MFLLCLLRFLHVDPKLPVDRDSLLLHEHDVFLHPLNVLNVAPLKIGSWFVRNSCVAPAPMQLTPIPGLSLEAQVSCPYAQANTPCLDA